MRNTAEGARGREGATRSAVSVPGWVSRGDPPLRFPLASGPPRWSTRSHPGTFAFPLPFTDEFIHSFTNYSTFPLLTPPPPSTLCQALSLQWERQSDTE